MIDKEKKDKEIYMDKVKDYVLIFFFIAFIIFVVIYMEHQKMQHYKNQDITTISASAKTINEISNYDNITDLTNTIWVINSSITAVAGYGQFDIYYDINDISYYNFNIGYGVISNPNPPPPVTYGVLSGCVSDSAWNILANNNEWQLNYPILFTGGTDATNANLISWLQANATQIYTGYSSTITLTNCTCNKSSETGLNGSYTAIIIANPGYYLTNVTTTLGTVTYSNENKVATISISDVTEDFTISATASLIYHNISYNLGNVVIISNKPTQIDEISTITITFQPFSNYVLPEYINVEGVTIYQWNKDTGVLTLSNAYDNVDITINAEYKSGQYTFVELIDSVTLVPVNTFFNLFNFDLLGINIYNLLLSALILFIIIKIILKVFK